MTKNEMGPGRGPVWPLAVYQQGGTVLPTELAQPVTSASSSGVDLNLGTIWRIVSEWRWLVLGIMAVTLAGALIVTLLTTPLYRAAAVLEINRPSMEIMDESKSRSGGGEDASFLATQYGLLQSRSLAERVVQEMNLASNQELVPQELDRAARQKVATSLIQSNLTVKPVPNSRLVSIAYSSPSPTLAAQVTNSIADNFINSNLERRYESSSYARDFLQRQIARVRADLEKSERQLVAYAQSQGIINTATGEDGRSSGDVGSLQGASLVALNEALAEAQTKRIAAEQRYRQTSAVGTTAEVNESTASMRAQRATLEAEYQEKLASFKAEYPDMVRLRSRIDALNDQIRREAGNVAGGRRNSLLADYQAAAAEERSLQARVSQLKGSVMSLRGRSIQYNILQRDVDTNRTLYDALLQRYKEIGVAGGIGTNLVSIVDRAQVPGAPYKPNLILNLLIGLSLGLLTGVGAALALEFINDTITTPDDVREKLHLTSLGVIPKKLTHDTLEQELKDHTSAVSEAYFSLRTALQFSTAHGAPRTLLISSTRAAEGKSSTTLALAQNFARLGRSVLLIDGDLRKPAFVTGANVEGGLSKLLTNDDPLRGHVLKTDFENLWLVPCGPLPPNPAELLASPRLKALLAEAQNEFDMVIVDGPPVLGLADAPLLGAICETTLMVIESGKTRTKAASDATNRLKAAGAHIIGAVLTKYRHRSGGYGYSYEPYKYGGVGSREREIHLLTRSDA